MKASQKSRLAEQRVQYEAWYDEPVRLGLEDIEAGRVVSDEQATEHMRRVREALLEPKQVRIVRVLHQAREYFNR